MKKIAVLISTILAYFIARPRVYRVVEIGKNLNL